jgi:hypothetical protein
MYFTMHLFMSTSSFLSSECKLEFRIVPFISYVKVRAEGAYEVLIEMRAQMDDWRRRDAQNPHYKDYLVPEVVDKIAPYRLGEMVD